MLEDLTGLDPRTKGNEMKLFWMDLETTGLDPATCVVLEVAYAVASLDRPFDPEVYGQMTVRHMRREGDGVDPVVVDMHTKNGLWGECQNARFTVADVEEHLLTIVPEVDDWEDKPTLAGNCVGFDHGFLKRYAPKLAARFHYRYYDVSSVKLFCRSLGMPRLPSGESHRAADDVRESIEHARQCAAWMRGPAEVLSAAQAVVAQARNVSPRICGAAGVLDERVKAYDTVVADPSEPLRPIRDCGRIMTGDGECVRIVRTKAGARTGETVYLTEDGRWWTSMPTSPIHSQTGGSGQVLGYVNGDRMCPHP